MNQSLKDLIQVITWVVTAFGGLIAAFKAVSELRRSNEEKAEAIREQREQFRWRQAEMARTILDQTWSNDLAKSALLRRDRELMLGISSAIPQRSGFASAPD